MHKNVLKSVTCLFTLLIASAQVFADQIVAWDLAGAPGNQVSQAPSSAAANITGLNITRGAGLNAAAALNSFSSSGWGLLANDVVQLGFNIASGAPWQVDTLVLGSRSSGTGPGTINVSASVDGGAFFLLTSITQPDSTFVNSIVNINQIVASSLIIQFAAANNTSANGGTIGSAGTWRITDYVNPQGTTQDVIVSGSLIQQVVPVPSGIVLSGIALCTVLGVNVLRRRTVRFATAN